MFQKAPELLRLAWPSVGSLILDQAAGLTTIFFVAALDDKYLLGSVGLGSMAQNVFGFSLGIGVNSALNTLVSQSKGAGRLDLCCISLQQAQVLCILVAFPSMLLMWRADALFRAVGINPRTAQDAGLYVRGTIFVMPFHFLACATRSFLRAMQLPRPIFLVSTVVVICHPLWCFLLIHRWEKGAFGAGLTVTLSYGLNFLLLTSYVAIVRPGPCKEAWRILPLELLSQKCRRTGVSDCDNSSFAAYLRVALPSAVLMWAEWWAYEAMSLLAGLCGKTGLAAHTAACSVLLIVFQLPTGLGNATSAMVGHAIGAGSSTDAKSSLKVAVMLILSTCLLVAVILIPSRFFIARLYTSDPDVLSTLELLCVILGLFQLFDGLQTVLESGLIGLGMQKAASRIKLLTMLVVRLGGAYVLSLPLASGVVGIWVAGVVGMMVTVALYLCLLRRCNFEYLASSVQRELMSA
ncbi:unnamed protein product [Durusdinium trenchii]|uniref:Protein DETOXIFICATION n=1 Tax=Durusdinium trenchii TaxID=1381693 RepID=A0ABP0HCD6_9DINO